jgi:hypothetical protein
MVKVMSNFYSLYIKKYEGGYPFRFYAKKFRVDVAIKDLEMLKGEIPSEVRIEILKWVKHHQKDLKKNWDSYKIKKSSFKPKPKFKKPPKIPTLSYRKIYLNQDYYFDGTLIISGIIFFTRYKNWMIG